MTDSAFHFIRRMSNRWITLVPLFRLEPLFAATGAFLGISLLVTLGALMLDTRIFQGENIWVKPIKFQVSLSIYLLTLSFFARWLPKGMTKHNGYRIYAGIVVFAVLTELVWIGGAAMFGTASHFSIGTPFKDVLYAMMGVFAVMLTTASLVYGIAIWRNTAICLDPALKFSIVLGLVLTFVLTVPIAGTMSAMLGHLVGTPELDIRVPFMGWSREVGDLRVAHFFGTHAMHFLPVFGLITLLITKGKVAMGFVWITIICFTAFTIFTFAQAIMGQPLIPVF